MPTRPPLSGLVEAPVTSFACPFGDADDRVRTAVAATGFTTACRTSGQGDWADPFDLPRQAMGNGSSALGLRLKQADQYESVLAGVVVDLSLAGHDEVHQVGPFRCHSR